MSMIKKIEENPIVSLIILCSIIIPATVGVTSWFFNQRIENIKSQHASVNAAMIAKQESSLAEIRIELLRIKHPKVTVDKTAEDPKKTSSITYKVLGKCNGNPYINVEIYVDNPPDESNKPYKNIAPIIEISGGKNTIPFASTLQNYDEGVHRLDVYVGFPGNNEALIEIQLIAISEGSESIIGSYVVDNYSAKNNIGPHYPYYRTSIPFVI